MHLGRLVVVSDSAVAGVADVEDLCAEVVVGIVASRCSVPEEPDSLGSAKTLRRVYTQSMSYIYSQSSGEILLAAIID